MVAENLLPHPAFVRLGPSSAQKSKELASAPAGPSADPIELVCAQVPQDFAVGSPAWLWLGSDNNKGQATEWVQGIRAIGRCVEKESLEGKQFRIVLGEIIMLPRSIEKLEVLQASPETYAQSLSNAAIIGLNNYSAQVVQLLSGEEFATIGAVIARLIPDVRESIFAVIPNAEDIKLVARPATPAGATPIGLVDHEEALLSDDDPIYQDVVRLAIDDQMGGVLLVGVPGTGKSWYARQIAKKLTGGRTHRMREVQFHPSYQYEDFVEGYVPDPQMGFRLADKHLLEMVAVAEATDEPVVMIIDEFSRTDPSRVLGEAMTYMEGSLRGLPFYLPSGRKTSLPRNLIFLATMNPDDRSVDEIDDAMDRRWAKISLEPDVNKVRDFLLGNGAPAPLKGPILQFFAKLQQHLPVGHAFFRTVKDRNSLSRLWDMQLKYFVSKRFKFDPAGKAEVEALWEECNVAIEQAMQAGVQNAADADDASAQLTAAE